MCSNWTSIPAVPKAWLYSLFFFHCSFPTRSLLYLSFPLFLSLFFPQFYLLHSHCTRWHPRVDHSKWSCNQLKENRQWRKAPMKWFKSNDFLWWLLFIFQISNDRTGWLQLEFNGPIEIFQYSDDSRHVSFIFCLYFVRAYALRIGRARISIAIGLFASS